MKKRNLLALVAAGATGLVLVLTAGVVLTAPDTALPWTVFGAGGGSSSSPNYALGSTAGQPAPIGESRSTNYALGAGFGYGAMLAVPAPDLFETSVSDPPSTKNIGAGFSVTDTAKNQGDAQAVASKTRYYLSTDKVRDSADKLLTGTRAVPGLAPGQSSTGSKTVTIPTSTVLGTYYLLACADDTGLVAESDETNNCLASVGTIQVTAPDLVETAVSKPPASRKLGGSFNVTDTAKNMGTGPAGASTTRYYLSLDKTKSAADVLLTGSRTVPALAVGVTSKGTVSVTVSATTPLGTYYLLACADDLKVVKESKEGNNCRASAGTIQIVP